MEGTDVFSEKETETSVVVSQKPKADWWSRARLMPSVDTNPGPAGPDPDATNQHTGLVRSATVVVNEIGYVGSR